LNDDTHPLAAIVTYQFPARGSLPPVKLTWYEGTRAPRPPELEDGRVMGDSEGGVIFKGSKGKIMCGTYGNGPRLLPESAMKEYKRPAPALERIKDSHEMDWVRAAKSGQKAGACFEYSGPLTEVCLLGNVAKKLDTKITWDAQNCQVTNLPNANALIKRDYRNGWGL
jgi:hypothetical protein